MTLLLLVKEKTRTNHVYWFKWELLWKVSVLICWSCHTCYIIWSISKSDILLLYASFLLKAKLDLEMICGSARHADVHMKACSTKIITKFITDNRFKNDNICSICETHKWIWTHKDCLGCCVILCGWWISIRTTSDFLPAIRLWPYSVVYIGLTFRCLFCAPPLGQSFHDAKHHSEKHYWYNFTLSYIYVLTIK